MSMQRTKAETPDDSSDVFKLLLLQPYEWGVIIENPDLRDQSRHRVLCHSGPPSLGRGRSLRGLRPIRFDLGEKEGERGKRFGSKMRR